MKKTILTYGLIAGALISTFMIYMAYLFHKDPNMKSNEILGYGSMILSFSMIFVGVKNYRDNYSEGIISFGNALKIGLLITLVASTMYVITWLIYYYCFIPDFIDKYITHVMNEAQAQGLSQVELDKKAAEFTSFKEMYKNPLFAILMTYAEIVPVGIVISLISAGILKKK